MTFLSDLAIDGLSLNGEELGQTFINAERLNAEQKIHLDAWSMRGQLKVLGITGDYDPESQQLDFELALDKLRLNIIEPYLASAISDLNGITSGFVKLTGTTNQPLFNWNIQIQKTSLKVDYLQTVYSF